VSFIVEGFRQIWRSESELKEVLRLLGPIYEEHGGRDGFVLMPYIKAMQERFAVRAVDAGRPDVPCVERTPPDLSTDELRDMVQGRSPLSLSAGEMLARQLSKDAKRVIVAAFIASYNPANMDKRIFGMSKNRPTNPMSKAAVRLLHVGTVMLLKATPAEESSSDSYRSPKL
jgi:hypothetical protein